MGSPRVGSNPAGSVPLLLNNMETAVTTLKIIEKRHDEDYGGWIEDLMYQLESFNFV